MNRTSIEWTHRPQTGGARGGFTWNPIRALSKSTGSTGTFCTRISPGCKHCYASVINRRFGTGLPFEVPHLGDHEFYVDERILQEPLRRKKPATIFVGDMFDLFHEAIPMELVCRVVLIMAQAQAHTFQVLTKRTARMHEFFAKLATGAIYNQDGKIIGHWPLPNVWVGTSVESQKYADERIPFLQQTPAAIRFLSIEPQLERVLLPWSACPPRGINVNGAPLPIKLNWVICGGESGPDARQFNVQWAEDLLLQCRRSGVAFFMKQLGSNAGYIANDVWVPLPARSKGGDLKEIPEALRVREWPR